MASDLFWLIQALLLITKDIGMSDLTWFETLTPLLCYSIAWIAVIIFRITQYNSSKSR